MERFTRSSRLSRLVLEHIGKVRKDVR